jgi:hypothetical protein
MKSCGCTANAEDEVLQQGGRVSAVGGTLTVTRKEGHASVQLRRQETKAERGKREEKDRDGNM